MTDFPSSATERICGALNRLVSDVIINWHAQRSWRKMSLIPSASQNVVLVMACRWIAGILKIDAMGPEESTQVHWDATGTTLADASTQWCSSGDPMLICIIGT